MEQRSLFVQASVFGFSFDDRLSHVSASNSGLGYVPICVHHTN